ncbi:biotin/lipoyl-containing protein, partial [Phyllobacterium sp.]|nr:2-oxo acid dehydrogenase subunit E2 [Phyllobacterium sp.]
MGEFVIKLPDVGEGVAEAELVEWHVKVGDLVREDMILAAVMTDKATVEIPSPVDGEILWLGGEIGQVIAIGSPIIRLKVEGEGHAPAAEPAKPVKAEEPKPQPAKAEPKPEIKVEKPAAPVVHAPVSAPVTVGAPRAEGDKPLAPPAVRLRAREAGVDLRQV